MSDPTSLPAEIGCECHLGDFESPECGKRAVCQIEGLFVFSGCKIRVLTKYPTIMPVEETASDWGDRIQARLKREAAMKRILQRMSNV